MWKMNIDEHFGDFSVRKMCWPDGNSPIYSMHPIY
jgi:hypothetical protein